MLSCARADGVDWARVPMQVQSSTRRWPTSIEPLAPRWAMTGRKRASGRRVYASPLPRWPPVGLWEFGASRIARTKGVSADVTRAGPAAGCMLHPCAGDGNLNRPPTPHLYLPPTSPTPTTTTAPLARHLTKKHTMSPAAVEPKAAAAHPDSSAKNSAPAASQKESTGFAFPAAQTYSSPEEERQARKERLALAYRVFGQLGYDEGVAGHLTYRDPILKDHFWVNPFGLNFRHMTVSDLLLIGPAGKIKAGGKPELQYYNAAAFAIHHAIHSESQFIGMRVGVV